MACLRCARVKTLNQSVQTDPFPAKPEAPRPSEPEAVGIESGVGEETGRARASQVWWQTFFRMDSSL